MVVALDHNRGHNYTRFATPGSGVQVKASPGCLVRILVTTAAATGTVSIYDDADGASGATGLISTIVQDAAEVAGETVLTKSYEFDCRMENGIYVTLDAGVTEVTVVWR